MKFLPVLVLLVQQPAADPPKWQTHTLVKSNELTVRLLVRPEAAMLQTGWIKLELENHTQQPLHLVVRCRAESLFQSFTDTDFIVKDARGRVGPLTEVPPGVTVMGEDLLAYAIANTLKMPPEKGRKVDARIQFSVNVHVRGGGRGTRIMTPAPGEAISFTWVRPTRDQLAKAREDLTAALQAAPADRTALDRERLQALLGVPELHADIPTDKVLAALARYSHNNYRSDLYRLLVLPRRTDARVVAYFHDRITAGDEAAIYDLIQSDFRLPQGAVRAESIHLWDRSFTEPAVALYEKDPQKYRQAFNLLSMRAREWSGDAKVTGRLAAAVRKLHPVLDKKLDGLGREDVEHLMRGVQQLGQTYDRASLPLLKKTLALDYTSPFPPPMIHMPNHPTGVSVSHQSALAVAQILDGDHAAMSQWIRQRAKGPATAADPVAYARDRLERWEAESKKPK